MMEDTGNQVGRPPLTDVEVDKLFRKLEPHLKVGLSINKACLKARIPKSTVYDLCKENPEFAEKVELAKNYCSILIQSTITQEIMKLGEYSRKYKYSLENYQLKFLQWAAEKTNSGESKSTEEK